MSKYVQNTITRYHMDQKKLFGNFQASARYDILTVIFICLGTEPDETQQKLLSMLETLFSKELNLEDKKHILEEEYSLPMTIELRKELKQMGSWLKDYFEEGVSKGSKINASENAKKLFINGVSYDIVRTSIDILTDEELKEIYDEVMGVTRV